jgi:hypothetical protein
MEAGGGVSLGSGPLPGPTVADCEQWLHLACARRMNQLARILAPLPFRGGDGGEGGRPQTTTAHTDSVSRLAHVEADGERGEDEHEDRCSE